MTQSGTGIKKRPLWAVVMRAAGMLAAIGCVIALAGMLTQTLPLVNLGTALIVGAAVVAAGDLIVMFAARR